MRRRTTTDRDRVTLKALTFNEWFSFACGWAPPPSMLARGTRWRTWAEFLDTYADVRDEFLADRRAGAPSFAEFLSMAPRSVGGREAAIERYELARDASRRRAVPPNVVLGGDDVGYECGEAGDSGRLEVSRMLAQARQPEQESR